MCICSPFFNLHLSIVSSKIYYKRDDFDHDIVNFTVLDGDVPRRASYMEYTFYNILGLLECAVM